MRRIKKKLLAGLMTAVMAVSLFPNVALASDGVIDTEAELIAAVEAGGDVVVGGDIELTAPIVAKKNVTLTAEKAVKLTDKNSKGDLFTATDGATLTLGKNITAESGVSTLWANGGTIVVDGATVVCTHPQYALGAAYPGGTIEVKSGTLTAVASAISVNGGAAIVSGGTVESTGKDSNGDGYVTIFVHEGSATGGSISITGGTVKAAVGAAVDANQGEVTIEGGEIIGGADVSAVASTNGTVTISGGTFSSKIADEYLSKDCTTVTNEDGNTVVGTEVDTEAELVAAVSAGGTVVIAGDIELTAPIVAKKNVTLTAEKAVKLTDKNSKGDLFTATDGATLTLGKNITAESGVSTLWANGGTIVVDGATVVCTHPQYALGAAYPGGTIEVKSGTLTAVASAISVNGGAAIVSGGTVESTGKDSNGDGYVTIFVHEGSATGGSISITGGTVKAAVGAAVDANQGEVTIEGGEIIGGADVSAVVSTNGTVAISGGTFSSAIADEYLADGYGDFEVTDGKFTVHKHTVVEVAAVEPTCTETGSTAGTKCSECNEILSGCEEVEATGHTLTAVAAKEATTEAEGNKAYWTCECGKWFADKDGKTEITDKTSVVIPKVEKPEEPVEEVAEVTVSYSTHVQKDGWLDPVADGKSSGTVGEAKRLESIKIEVETDADLGISYSTHVQSKGWIDPVADGKESGTTGESKRLEAIKIELTGADKDKYNVWYRVHAQSYGWLGWAKNGEAAGTAGQSKRLEAIEIVVLPVGETPEGQIGYAYIELGKTADNKDNAGLVNYMTHVQSYGDQSYVSDGSIAGTFGEAKRLEAISINLNTELLGVDGGIKYKTHVQKDGWLEYVADGKESGTTGQAKRLEAICIELTGDVAEQYDVYYRVHAQTYGWLGWAKNGEEAGTAGLAKRLEAIQIVLVPKGQDAPSILPGVEGTKAFIEK